MCNQLLQVQQMCWQGGRSTANPTYQTKTAEPQPAEAARSATLAPETAAASALTEHGHGLEQQAVPLAPPSRRGDGIAVQPAGQQCNSSASSPSNRPAADRPPNSPLQPGECATAGLEQELSAGQPSPATDREEPCEPASAALTAAGIRPNNSQSDLSQHGGSDRDDFDDSDAESPARLQQPSQTTAAATTSQPDSSSLTIDELIAMLVGNTDTLSRCKTQHSCTQSYKSWWRPSVHSIHRSKLQSKTCTVLQKPCKHW